jgi:signal transduction histidine kinase
MRLFAWLEGKRMASTLRNDTRPPSVDTTVDASADQLARLARHLIKVGDDEKARLARELHNELGSNLTAVNLDVAAVEDKLKGSEPALAVRLRRALDSLRAVVGLSRRVIEELRPSALDNMDLAEALRGYCEEFTERTGLECDADLADIGPLERNLSIALFRVAQQALDNAALHARASRVTLVVALEEKGLRLRVADNGSGLPDDAFDRPAAHGLLEARERAAMVGGTFAAGRGEGGRGTVVEIFVPIL